jgi:hypothetical protein
MTTILPPQLGTAQLMCGCPCTEDGTTMITSSWYRITSPEGQVRYVALSLHGVYECTPTGRVRDFFQCLYERRAVESQADALRRIGFAVSV